MIDRRDFQLPGVRACDLFAYLEELVEEIKLHSGPHRPLPYPLIVRRGEPALLHPAIELKYAQLFLIYSQEPCPTLPHGRIALWVGALPQGGCGAECCGRCEGELRIDIWQQPTFPYSEEEVNTALARRCGLRGHAMMQVADPGWQALLEYQGELEELVAAPRGAGAPPLRCNEWLLGCIRNLSDPRANRVLMKEWLRRHAEETGEPLRCPARSFAKAAARCVAIVEEERARRPA
jgi:hypothetical protein